MVTDDYNVPLIKQSKRRRWTREELNYVKDNYGLLEMDQMTEKLNRSERAIRLQITRHGFKHKGQAEFAIYYGDEYQFTGNRQECINYMGIDAKTFEFYRSPSHKRRPNIQRHVVDIGRWPINEYDN